MNKGYSSRRQPCLFRGGERPLQWDPPETHQGVYIFQKLSRPKHQHPSWRILPSTFAPNHKSSACQNSKRAITTGTHTIDGITDNGIASTLCLDDNGVLFLLRYNYAYLATILHRIQKDLVSQNIEFLLVVSSGIARAGQAKEINQRCSSNIMCNELASQLKSAVSQISSISHATPSGGAWC